MPPQFDLPPDAGARVQQGELLAKVWEHRPTSTEEVEVVEFLSVVHPLVVVLTPDCDIESDFSFRADNPAGSPDHPRLVPCLMLCDVEAEADVQSRLPGSDVFKRVRQNQDERYHYFPEAGFVDPGVQPLPAQITDFKKAFTVPTPALYSSLGSGKIARIGCLTGPHLYDLLHRFYAFQSRVGVD